MSLEAVQEKIHKVVVADDHAILRSGLASLINNVSNLTVSGEAADGVELLEILKEEPADLVILDLTMPRMDGLEAIEKIVELSPDTKILILTMHKSRALFKQSLAKGAHGYIIKDEAFDHLVTAVQSVLDGEEFYSNGVLYDLAGEMKGEVPEEAGELSDLTGREMEVLKLVARGHTSRGIAQDLKISARTVEVHRASIRRKLRINDLAGLIEFAKDHKML